MPAVTAAQPQAREQNRQNKTHANDNSGTQWHQLPPVVSTTKNALSDESGTLVSVPTGEPPRGDPAPPKITGHVFLPPLSPAP